MSTDSKAGDLIRSVTNLLGYPNVAGFVYYSVIALTGFFLIRTQVSNGFNFTQNLVYLVIWLWLIVILEPPRGAELKSEPFADPGVIPRK